MEERDREVLRETASEQGYTSIAINKDGKHVGGCFIPWKLTSSAINMKTPRITLAVEDLQDETIMADVKKCKVLGCYIMIPLEDYHRKKPIGMQIKEQMKFTNMILLTG